MVQPDTTKARDLTSGPEQIAMEAWRRNAHGHATGEFEPWFALLDDDVVITMPLGPFRGSNHGIATARQIYAQISAAKPRLVYEQPLRVSQTGATVVIEFDDHGTIAGFPYRNRIAASFDVGGEKVTAYREYFGDIDPVMVRMMNGEGAAHNG